MKEDFNRDEFANAIGSGFTLTDAQGHSVELELIEVSDLRERPHQVSYSIVFAVPEDYVVGQGLYDLQHPTLGALQLFLVPVMPVGNQLRLEAVFNFLREQAQSPSE